ncbi:hypothetical protein CMI47_06450 [Candidatus Pacearchaeota archaeon]|nr:hypothetical protein [Candidatus Pacearchaeota archaeon]|tara:strand:+ start:8358 stop:9572 length:1215 start_codon:yes stop_codon:yes gene_type:complete
MSSDFAKSNGESARQLFFKRNNYLLTAQDINGSANLVDFNFGEKFFYGRVDRYFIPIYFNERRHTLKSYEGSNQKSGAPLRGAGFVVDAFSALAQQFKKCATTRKISAKDKYLSNLQVYKGYEDPLGNYGKYFEMLKGVYLAQFRKNSITFPDFFTFIEHLMNYINLTAQKYPFTFPAYLKSRISPITYSGLAVEIADLDPTNDEDKINDFVSSLNWDFYVNACKNYGFMIDKFIPWRLVADIGSAPMIEYAKQYSLLSSTDRILNNAYEYAHQDYYMKFKYYLLNLYNTLKMTQYLVYEDCKGATLSHVITPKTYSVDQLDKVYGEEQFLKLYFRIRFLEEQSQFTAEHMARLIDDSLEVYQAHDVRRSLYIFERILNKPFDYSGSLSYIIKQMDAIDEAEGL